MSNKFDPLYTIDMTVINDDDFLSPYSPTASPVISSDVAEFLENRAERFMPKQTIWLCVHSDCIDENEKIVYDSAIRNHFRLKLDGIKLSLRRNLVVSIIFTIIGILGLAVMLLLDRFFDKAIWTEVVDIFAWVFVWEAVDQFFIERRKLLLERKKYQAFTDMQITYNGIGSCND